MLDACRKDGHDWPAYAAKFRRLIARRRIETVLSPARLDGACLLCSEALPHHCHRRVVAAYLREKWWDVEAVDLMRREFYSELVFVVLCSKALPHSGYRRVTVECSWWELSSALRILFTPRRCRNWHRRRRRENFMTPISPAETQIHNFYAPTEIPVQLCKKGATIRSDLESGEIC